MDTNRSTARARIMVPLDGSPMAEAVLPHAATLAATTSAALDLVRVVEPHSARMPDYGAPETLETVYYHQRWQAELGEARDYLASVRHRIGGEGLEISCQVVEGDPAATLVQYAERDPRITTIAMTTHGRSGLGRWPLGSVTEKVLAATEKPLLVVRPGEGIAIPPIYSYRSILVPLDGSVLAEQALDQARTLALGTGAALLLISVLAPPDDMGLLPSGVHLPLSFSDWEAEAAGISQYLERIARELCDSSLPGGHPAHTLGLPVETRVLAGRPADAILSISEQVHSDMIVMSTHGKSALENGRQTHTWLGSIALRVVQGSHAPVLLIRSREVPGFRRRAESEGLENHMDGYALASYSGAIY